MTQRAEEHGNRVGKRVKELRTQAPQQKVDELNMGMEEVQAEINKMTQA